MLIPQGKLLTFCISGQISNTIPFTNYSVVAAACTGGGCTESAQGVVVVTFEERESESNCYSIPLI